MDAAEAKEAKGLPEVQLPILGQNQMERSKEVTTVPVAKKRPLDPKADLRLIMIADGTIDALIEEGFGFGEDPEPPERKEAREATREYCIKYLATVCDGGDLNMTLGDLAIAIDFFYDGYRSGLKREVILD
jgi:hypothetical protein